MVAKTETKGATTKSGKPAKGTKGKKTGKKNVSHRSAMLLDGLPVSEMSREQLLSHLTRLLDQLEKEREERNYFQLERDQIYGFWKVAKDDVDDVRARLRNKEKELDDAEELRQKDVAIYKQQIKCLLHEHQTTLADFQAEQQTALELAHLQHQEQERTLEEEKQRLKEENRQLTLAHQVTIDRLKTEHTAAMSELRKKHERECRDLEKKYQDQLDDQRNELEKRRRNDLQEIDTKDQHHVSLLIANHEKAIIDLKNYFNNIILNNMTLITTMKEQMTEFRHKEERLEKQFQASNKEIRQLKEKCEYLEKKNKELEKDTENWAQAKTSLHAAKGQYKAIAKQLEEMTWRCEVKEQELLRVRKERDELEERFMAAILEIQQKANLKQIALEKKLEMLQDAIHAKDLALKQFASSQSDLQRDTGTSEADTGTSSLTRERRKQTVVKMNFESREQEGIRDKSFHSSNDSIHIEEKLSLHSINGSVKSVGSWKSLSAIMNLEREDEIKLSCRRKLVSAD